jgi:uncharacterized membrane protein
MARVEIGFLMTSNSISPKRAPLLSAGIVLGAGLGGFVDGILFHHLLQWHQMISAKVSNATLVGAKINMYWDGVFHAGMWSLTVLGLVLLFRAAQKPHTLWSGQLLFGAMLLGWGIFNLADGISNHHIFALHHLREYAANPLLWDLGYLVSGVVLAIVGWLIMRGVISGVTSPSRTRLES